MSFEPLKHGERFTYAYVGGVGRYLARVGNGPTPRPHGEAFWAHSKHICREDNEGVTWARGWNTKAAAALRVACAL